MGVQSNPFQYGVVVSGDAYCPRVEMETSFADILSSGQKTVIKGVRRSGKTSFVRNIGMREYGDRFLRVDLYGLADAEDLMERIARAVFRSRKISGKGRFEIEFNLPLFRVKYSQNPEYFLDLIDEWGDGKNGLLFFDEFQDILRSRDSRRILALLREKLQFLKQPVVFAGSAGVEIASMFADYGSPLYQAARVFELDPIPVEVFKAFLLDKFRLGGYSVLPDFWDQLESMTGWVPGYAQQVCSMVWSLAKKSRLDAGECVEAFNAVADSESVLYQHQLAQLTLLQRRTLTAIANQQYSGHLDKRFLEVIGNVTTSAAAASLKALKDKKMIFLNSDSVEMFSPFFRHWLADKYNT